MSKSRPLSSETRKLANSSPSLSNLALKRLKPVDKNVNEFYIDNIRDALLAHNRQQPLLYSKQSCHSSSRRRSSTTYIFGLFEKSLQPRYSKRSSNSSIASSIASSAGTSNSNVRPQRQRAASLISFTGLFGKDEQPKQRATRANSVALLSENFQKIFGNAAARSSSVSYMSRRSSVAGVFSNVNSRRNSTQSLSEQFRKMLPSQHNSSKRRALNKVRRMIGVVIRWKRANASVSQVKRLIRSEDIADTFSNLIRDDKTHSDSSAVGKILGAIPKPSFNGKSKSSSPTTPGIMTRLSSFFSSENSSQNSQTFSSLFTNFSK